MTETHPLTKLPELVTEIKVRLELERAVIDGAPLPITYREAVRYLVHRLFLRSSRYRDLVHTAETAGLDPLAVEFVQAFQRHMAGLGIPVYCDVAWIRKPDAARMYVLGQADMFPNDNPYAVGRAVDLAHALRGRKLPALCWDVFGHVGVEVAGKLGIGVQWGGHTAPWQWLIEP